MKHVSRSSWSAFVVVAILLVSMPANSFWSALRYSIHQDMTTEILERKSFTWDSVNYSFQPDAIAAINAMHKIADTGPYDRRDHFDSESFDAGYRWLKNRRATMMRLLAASPAQSDEARGFLGLMLHQVQDFYSHSNWAASQTGIVDFGKATSAGGATPSFVKASADIGAACGNGGVSLLSTFTGITTGYYAPLATPANKCNHGNVNWGRVTAGYGIKMCARSTVGLTVTPDGINRDHPCFSNDADIRQHLRAVSLAKQETRVFVQSIVNELQANKNVQGFCALLGLNLSAAPCNGTAGAPNTDIFVKWNVDNRAFGPVNPCNDQSYEVKGGVTGSIQGINQCSAGFFTGGTSIYIEAGAPDGSGSIDLSQDLPFTSVLVPAGTKLTPGQVVRSQTYVQPINLRRAPQISDLKVNLASVVYGTGRSVPNTTPPIGDLALLSTWAYLAANTTASPGTFTYTLYTVPGSNAANANFLDEVATIYIEGSFDFIVAADNTIPQIFSYGTPRVTGTFRLKFGRCFKDSATTMMCDAPQP